MSQAGHHHYGGPLEAIHHPVEAVEATRVVPGQIAKQSVEALADSAGVLLQLGVDGTQAWLQMRMPFADRLHVALRGSGVQDRPGQRIWSRVFMRERASLAPRRTLAITAGWLAKCKVSAIAFHSSSETSTADPRRPMTWIGPSLATLSIRGYSRARAWLAGIATSVVMLKVVPLIVPYATARMCDMRCPMSMYAYVDCKWP